MKNCFYFIKKIIQTLVFALNLISFTIMILLIDYKKNNYRKYTNLSKFFLNFYIFSILFILLLHSIYPKILCSAFTYNFPIITKDIGKMIINLSIGILYWSSNNNPHVIFVIINFVSSFALFLCEFIFQCKILRYVHFDTESINEDKNESENSNDYNINNVIINEVSIDKKDEKNGNIFPLNDHIHIINNEFEIIHHQNLKVQHFNQ